MAQNTHYEIDTAWFYGDDEGYHLHFDTEGQAETLTYADWETYLSEMEAHGYGDVADRLRTEYDA